MKKNTLCIANNKGGVGKTSAAQNIGSAIGIFANKRTLLIDLDPQANLSKSFGIYLKNNQPNVGDFLLGKSTLADTVLNYLQTSIFILPSSIKLVDQEEDIKKHTCYPFILLKAIENLNYDFIIIDCPPMLSTFTKIALVASTNYYIPIQPEFFSYEGLREFINYVYDIRNLNPDLKLGGVFASRFNPLTRKNFNKEIITKIGEQLKDKLLKTYIRDNIAISQAQARGEPIFSYDCDSNGAQDYYNLTKEIFTK